MSPSHSTFRKPRETCVVRHSHNIFICYDKQLSFSILKHNYAITSAIRVIAFGKDLIANCCISSCTSVALRRSACGFSRHSLALLVTWSALPDPTHGVVAPMMDRSLVPGSVVPILLPAGLRGGPSAGAPNPTNRPNTPTVLTTV